MFVSQSKFDAMAQRAAIAEGSFYALLGKWTELVNRINAKGGEEFLNHAIIAPPQLTGDEIAKLIRLCHPDKHDGKLAAVEMTQRLLTLKQTVKG